MATPLDASLETLMEDTNETLLEDTNGNSSPQISDLTSQVVENGGGRGDGNETYVPGTALMEETNETLLEDTNGNSLTQISDLTSQVVENGGGRGDGDETYVPGTTFYREKRPPEAKMPVAKYALKYNMDHKNRGIALILNHEHFKPDTKQDTREGTNVDSESLETTLKQIGFDVLVYDDLSVSGVTSVVEEASKMDHSDSDCFLLACLSHGEENILYANDAVYKPDTLWRQFTADKCPSLAGKPKLFFIQACQGKGLDGGITLRHTQTDSSISYKIPCHADFLIAYSTIPGFLSWRNPTQGSWFIQALCEQLKDHWCNLDILTLLTMVNQKVAVDFESYCPTKAVRHQKKQIPCINFTLTRLLRFTPKKLPNNEM